MWPLLLLAAAGGVYWYEKNKPAVTTEGLPNAPLTDIKQNGTITVSSLPLVFIFGDNSTLTATLPFNQTALTAEQSNPGSTIAAIKKAMNTPVVPSRAQVQAELATVTTVAPTVTSGMVEITGVGHGGHGGHGGGHHGGHHGHGFPVYGGWGGGYDGGGDTIVNVNTNCPDGITQDPLCAGYAYHGSFQQPVIINCVRHHPNCPSLHH